MSEEQPAEKKTEAPVKSSIMSWSEVYGVKTCDDCGKTDCPHCTKKFLRFLNHQGSQPRGRGPQ